MPPFAGRLALAALACIPAACSAGQPSASAPCAPAESARSAAPASVPSEAPASGTTVRVGGDAAAAITREGELFRSGDCEIDTPLPVGYPDPTPPGAIDLKTYPGDRRAQVSGSVNPDLGMNMGFWPLFRHISRRDIAMTSPVVLDYHAAQGEEPKDTSDRWTMAFLYREAANGPTGEDGKVEVVDTQPVTVLSLGFRGSYSESNSRKHVEQLREWLKSQTAWEAVGDGRVFYYNGPNIPSGRKWAEAQLQVRPVRSPEPGNPAVPPAAGASAQAPAPAGPSATR